MQNQLPESIEKLRIADYTSKVAVQNLCFTVLTEVVLKATATLTLILQDLKLDDVKNMKDAKVEVLKQIYSNSREIAKDKAATRLKFARFLFLTYM